MYQTEKNRVSKYLLNISKIFGFVFVVLLGAVATSASAMTHMISADSGSYSAMVSKTTNVGEAINLQIHKGCPGKTSKGCQNSNSVSCPPFTCMAGVIAYPGKFVADPGYSFLVPVSSLQTNYLSLATDFFRPPRL